ncbi:MAG TPA: PAS domain S-box protein, partial [Solirubrobacteraceae bacterium]|nr:PAS domain S-box protein [Solirubrobacteraceae bacterium]
METSHYLGVAIVDTHALMRVAAGDAEDAGSVIPELLPEALRGQPSAIEFRQDRRGRAVLAAIAPIPSGPRCTPDGVTPCLGAAMLFFDPNTWLYPYLRRALPEITTGEVLLAELDGNHVVFLSPLRKLSAQPMSLRPAVSGPVTAAIAAVRGVHGFGVFPDYKGDRVFASTTRIPNTRWALVVKVDEHEALAPYREHLLTRSLIVFGLLAAVVGVGYGLWRGRSARYESALAASEARSSLLIENANDVILFCSRDLRILDANRKAEAFYGYTREELLQLSIPQLRAEETLPELPGEDEAIRAGGHVFETIHKRKDGARLPVEVSANLVNLGREQVYLAIVRDISERRRQAAAIIHLNRLLRTISAVNQLIVRERDRDRLLSRACEILVEHGGFRLVWVGLVDDVSSEIRPAAWAGHEDGYLSAVHIHADDSPLGHGAPGTAARLGRADVIDDTEHEERFAPWRDEARRRGYRSMAAIPLRIGEKGRSTLNVYSGEPAAFAPEVLSLLEELGVDLGFAISAIENEERRREAVEALRRREEDYRRLFESVNDVILVWDPATEMILDANSKACAAYGYSHEELLGTSIERLTRDVRRDGNYVRRLLREGSLRGFDSVHTRRNGTPIHFRIDSSVVEYAGQQAIVSICRDLTQEVALEAQLRQAQKMEAIGQLAGGVAHDFNNLLQAMLSHVQVLRSSDVLSGPGERHLVEFEDQIKRGAALTRQLLLFARRETTKPEYLDLNDVVRNSVRLLQRLVPANIALTLELADQPLPVSADRGQLDQVLVNLVVNAVDAMPDGGKLAIRSGSVDPAWAWFAVDDTGGGIPAEIRERIFDPFFTTKPQGKGTGLGLS